MAAYDGAITSEDPEVIKAARAVQKTAVTKTAKSIKKEMNKEEEAVQETRISKEMEKLEAAFNKLEALHERYQQYRQRRTMTLVT